MPVVDLPDGSLYYVQKRAPRSPFPPVVLIHGAGGTHLDWPLELRRLPDAHILALDLPGHGRSSGPAHDDMLAYAGDVCRFLDAVGISRAIIVGHSMGGAIAQHIGIHMPDRVAGLVLLGTGSKLPVDPTLPQRIVNEPETTVNWITASAWSAGAAQTMKDLGRQQLLAAAPETLQADYRACQKFDVRDQIDQIRAPTLVIGAADDRMVPLKFSQTLHERIPNTMLVIIEDAGHMFPLERPAAVADAISHWIRMQDWTL